MTTVQVKYEGKARIRVEGYGYLEPDDVIGVSEEVAASLVQSADFTAVKQQTTRKTKDRSTSDASAPSDSSSGQDGD